MNPAKVTLSPKELILVSNTDWILTKNSIIQKVYELFGGLSATYRQAIESCSLYAQEQVLLRSPKISKGEQYEGLPWVMLDYPRHYTQTDAFGIRSFFWWGNGFSISLQLSGSFQKRYSHSVQQYMSDHSLSSGWLIGIGNDPWQHHFRENNYQPYSEELLEKLPFIKLTKRFPLTDWGNMETLLENGFVEILQMLAVKESITHYPGGETGL